MKINRKKITRGFCEGRVLIFFPDTEDEAAFIHRRLLALGAKLSDDAHDLERCVRKGMNLDRGVIYAAAPQGDIERGFLCDVWQFDETYLSPHQQLMACFNQLSAHMKEIARTVAEIQKELQPQKLDKPIVKKPEQEP